MTALPISPYENHSSSALSGRVDEGFAIQMNPFAFENRISSLTMKGRHVEQALILDLSTFTCSEHDPTSDPTHSACLNFPRIVDYASSEARQPLRRKNYQSFLRINDMLIFD